MNLRHWKVFLIYVATLCVLMGVASCSSEPEKTAAALLTAVPEKEGKFIIPKNQAYTGAYIDFGTTEDDVTLEGIERFDQLVGRRQALIGFSSYWGKQAFPAKAVQLIASYGAVPLIYWNPWDKPYEENRGPDRFNLYSIVEGKWDGYIDQWARGAKESGTVMLVSWGLEMNGRWFPWSGIFYGGEKPIDKAHPRFFKGAELFKKAYRHVVDRVRSQGADNIQWVFHANNTSIPDAPWNHIAAYWPGSEYVDWIGLSAYGKLYSGPGWASFDEVLPKAYREICRLDPQKPFVLAEWGVGEFPRSGSKAAFISDMLDRLSRDFPRLKAAVFWHERWQNDDLSYSNLHVNSSPKALEAYQKGISTPFWLDRPIFDHR
jgi:hypothetical protein